MRLNRFARVFYGTLLVFLVACCSPSVTQLTPSPTPVKVSATITLTPTPTVVTVTPTPALRVSTPTPSPTHTPTKPPTLTPLPTLTQKERDIQILQLLQTNGGCSLPCWWGISPGTTTWDTARQLFVSMGSKVPTQSHRDGSIKHEISFDLLESDMYVDIHISQRDGLIESIKVMSESYIEPIAFQSAWELYSLKQVLTVYGKPSRVWVQLAAGPVRPESTMGYGLWLFYDQLGFLIQYGGTGLKVQPLYHVCPTTQGQGGMVYIQLVLRAVENDVPLETLAGVTEEWLPYLLPIEEAAGLSVTEFYTLFRTENDMPCFDTPRDLWPGLR
mgnify:CR=1 FL=1